MLQWCVACCRRDVYLRDLLPPREVQPRARSAVESMDARPLDAAQIATAYRQPSATHTTLTLRKAGYRQEAHL